MRLVDDFRQAWRSLAATPGFLALAALVLGLGLGATIFMFGVIDTTLRRPAPYPRAERLYKVGIAEAGHDQDELDVAWPDFLEFSAGQRSFEDLAAMYTGTVVVSGEGLPARYNGSFVTGNLLRVLRVAPSLGRDFTAADDVAGAAPVAILGAGLWRSRFHSDPRVLGRPIRLNGRDATIIGVMPPGFDFPSRSQLWIPMARDAAKERRGDPLAVGVAAIGRLRDGASADQAAGEIAAVSARLAREYPRTNAGTVAEVMPLAVGIVGGSQTARALYSLFAAVWLVLLIACANVASLIFVRANFRVYESAMRSALGAPRSRLVSEVIAESLIIAALGAVVGLALASFGLYTIQVSIEALLDDAPRWWVFRIDWSVAAFTALAALGAGLLAGIVPALRASRPNVMGILRDGGRTGTGLRLGRFTTTMVILEIALSAALLTGAALMTRSSLTSLHQPIGADVRGFMSGRIMLPESAYPPERRGEFFERAVAALATRPGVQAATAATTMPGVGTSSEAYVLEGREYASRVEYSRGQYVPVAAGFFRAFGLPLLAGRAFDARDGYDAPPVAIVNQAFVRRHFPGGSPLGKRLRVNPEDGASRTRTIVGVVPDINHDLEWAPGGQYPAVVYTPLTQDPARFATVAVRVPGDPHRYTDTIREVVRQLDPDIAVYFPWTIEEHQARSRAGVRILAGIFGVFAVIAIVLSGAGIYGVLAFNARRRSREFGVRRALGARDRQVLAVVLKTVLVQLAVGLALGAVLAPLVGRVLANPLLGLPPDDPLIYGFVFTLLVAIALGASWIPALRALRVDPATALRYE